MKAPTTHGRHDNVLAHDYHQWPHISSSLLKAAAKGIVHARHYMNNPPSLGWSAWFGTYIHALLLEPELVEGQGEIKGLSGKALGPTFEKAAKKHGMPIPIAEGWIEQGRAVQDSIVDNGLADELLDSGDVEVSVTWAELTSSFAECDCKARFDLWCEKNNRIVDIKTTDDPSESAFERAAYNFGYHIQAAHYLTGAVEALGLDEMPEFWFIAIQNKPPFDVRVYRALPEQFIAPGMQARRELLDMLVSATTTGNWTEEQTEPHALSIPRWAGARFADGEIG